jgi:hypothetical protein
VLIAGEVVLVGALLLAFVNSANDNYEGNCDPLPVGGEL